LPYRFFFCLHALIILYWSVIECQSKKTFLGSHHCADGHFSIKS
jgi:hypothetical protein